VLVLDPESLRSEDEHRGGFHPSPHLQPTPTVFIPRDNRFVIHHSRPFPFHTTSTSPERLADFVIPALRDFPPSLAFPMTRQQVLDLYFMDARSKLIDIAAFLDRVDRSEGDPDFRLEAFRKALAELQLGEPVRARSVLMSLSDPTLEPIAKAPGKGAVGAWPGHHAPV
jgi:hypothetical protein